MDIISAFNSLLLKENRFFHVIKKNSFKRILIIQAFEAILSELTESDIEYLQDKLTIQLHKLTDDGTRYSLDEVKKQLS
ncbi:MAG TPA: hypothetical protein DEG28_03220 [Porphyromonadaceae bacterium]|nr:hypothetical protein [Porphyromonadaceae bacterium]